MPLSEAFGGSPRCLAPVDAAFAPGNPVVVAFFALVIGRRLDFDRRRRRKKGKQARAASNRPGSPRMNRFDISIFALASSLAFASSAAQSTGDAANGNTLYHTTYRCTTCHSSNPGPGNVVASGATSEGLHDA